MRCRNACVVFLVLAISIVFVISLGVQSSLSREPVRATNRKATPTVGGVTEVQVGHRQNKESGEGRSEITSTVVDDLSLLSSQKKHEDDEEEKLKATAEEEDSEDLNNSTDPTVSKWQRFEEEGYALNGNTNGNIAPSDANPFDEAEGGGGGAEGEGITGNGGKASGSMANSSSGVGVSGRRLNESTTNVVGGEPHTTLRGDQERDSAYGLRFLPWARVGPEFPHWQFLTNRVVGETRQKVMRSPLLCGDAMSEWVGQRESSAEMHSELVNSGDDADMYYDYGSADCEWYHVEAHPLRSPEGLATAVFPSPYPSALAARGTYEELSRVGRVRGSRPHAPFEVYKEASRPSALGSAKLKYVLSALTESFKAQMRRKMAGGINAQMLVRKFGHLLPSSLNSSVAATNANRPTQQQLKALASKVGLSRVPYYGIAPQRQNQLSAWWAASGLQHDAKIAAFHAAKSRHREKERQIAHQPTITFNALHSSESSNSTQLAATRAVLERPHLFFTPRQTHILETVLSRTYLPFLSAVAGQLASKNVRAISLAMAVGSLYTLVEPSNTELFVRSAFKHRIFKFLLRVSAADVLAEAQFHSRALTRAKALDPQPERGALALPMHVPSPTELVSLSAHSPMLLHLITNEMLTHHPDDRADETVGFVSYRAQQHTQTPPIEKGGTSLRYSSSTRRTASVWTRKKLSGPPLEQSLPHVSNEGFYNLITQSELSAISSSIASSANTEASTNPLIYNPKQQQERELTAGPPPRRSSAGEPTTATLPILESLERERASRNMLLRYSLMGAALCSTFNCSEPNRLVTHADASRSVGDDDVLLHAARNVSGLASPFPFVARVAPEVHRLSAVGQMAVAMRNRLVRLSPSANPFFEPVLHDAMRSMEEYPLTAAELGGGRDSSKAHNATTANHNREGSAANEPRVQQPILGMLSHAPANVKSSHVDAVSGHWNYSRLPSWLVLPAVVNVANCLDPLYVAKEHGREKETQIRQGDSLGGADGGSVSKSEQDSQKKRSILFLGSSHARNLFAALCHQYVHSRELVGRGVWAKKADVPWPLDGDLDNNVSSSTKLRYGQRIHRMRDLDAACAFDKREHRFGIVTRAQLMATLPPDDPYRRAVADSQRDSSQQGGAAEGAQPIRDPDTSPFSLAFFMQPYAHWADFEKVIELLAERLNALEGAPRESRKESAAAPFFAGSDMRNSSLSLQMGDARETLRDLATSLPRFVERVAATVDLESPLNSKAPPESHHRLNTPARFAYTDMFLRTKREDVERMRGLFTHVVFAPGVWESTFFDTTISEHAENIAVVLDLIDEVFAPQKIIVYNIHAHHDAFDSLDPTGEQLKSAAASRPHNFEGFVSTKNGRGLGEEEYGVRGGWTVPCAHRFRLAKFRDAHLCAATDAARRRVHSAWKREFEVAMRRPMNKDVEELRGIEKRFHQFEDDDSPIADSWHPRATVEIADMMPATSQSIAQLFVDNHGHHYSDVVLEAMSQRLLRDHICTPRFVAVKGFGGGNEGADHHSPHLLSTTEDATSHASGPNCAHSSLPSEFPAANSSPSAGKKGVASVVGFLRVVTSPRSTHQMPRLESVNTVKVGGTPPFVVGEIHDLFPLVKSPLPSVSAGLCRAIFDHPLAAVKPEVPSDRAVRPRRRTPKGFKVANEGNLIVRSTQQGSANKEAGFSIGSVDGQPTLAKYRSLGTLSAFNPFSVCPVCSCLRVARLVLKATTTTGQLQNESTIRNNKSINYSGRVQVSSNPLLVIRSGEKEDDRENADKALRSVRTFYDRQVRKSEEKVLSNNILTCTHNVDNGERNRQDELIVGLTNATKCDMAIISSEFPLRPIRHDENPFISVPLYASERYTNDERYLLRNLLSETRWDSCAVEETDEKERRYLSRRGAGTVNGVLAANSSTSRIGSSRVLESAEELVEEELELEEVSLCKGFREKKLLCSTSVTEELRRRLHSFAYIRSMMLIGSKSESVSTTKQPTQ